MFAHAGVTISNGSTITLANVVVSGSGFPKRIAAGAEQKFAVHPPGDSGLRVTLDAGGPHVDVDDLAYIEAGGGCRVVVTVQLNLIDIASSNSRA